MTTRWNSVRESRAIGLASLYPVKKIYHQRKDNGHTLTGTRASWHLASGHPPNFRSAGTTKILNITSADAGFPGSANTGLATPAQGIVANVVGLPGLTVTRPK
jgi:hypothetical protein